MAAETGTPVVGTPIIYALTDTEQQHQAYAFLNTLKTQALKLFNATYGTFYTNNEFVIEAISGPSGSSCSYNVFSSNLNISDSISIVITGELEVVFTPSTTLTALPPVASSGASGPSGGFDYTPGSADPGGYGYNNVPPSTGF
jgi:hypothetical protein